MAMDRESELEVLIIDGTAYPTRLHEKYRRRKPVPVPDPTEVRAFVPGTVLEVLVEPGQEVERGQPVVVIEAMKMRNALTAAAAGTVGEVRVTPGMLVSKGDLLVSIRTGE
jgi:biotin carboxyl carrier protein